MSKINMGNTKIMINKDGFGALPLQRIDKSNAVQLLRKAYENGILLFDTARFYSDSEIKIGLALKQVRKDIVIATKTMALNPNDFWQDLKLSLSSLQTDYVDIYQFHNPPFCPTPSDGSGVYEAMQEAKKRDLIRYIGLTNHRSHVVKKAIESRLYDTVQFPFSYISDEKEIEIVKLAQKTKTTFIAMKCLAGGLITNVEAAYAYINQFENVFPLWGIQKQRELDELLYYINLNPVLNKQHKDYIEKDRKALSSSFCRGCGYCLPCPAEIDIPTAARMTFILKRFPSSEYLTPAWKIEMKKIENCIHCNECKSRCPYGLDTPKLLEESLKNYQILYPEQ